MARQLMLVLVCAFLLSQAETASADDGPAKDVPELAVLSNYVGKWDVAITTEGTPFTKGEATARWILDGRFVEQSGAVMSADGATVLKVTTLMTYDQEKKAYRMWSFLSNGTTNEALGKWDAEKRSMTSVRRSDGATTTTTARFDNDGKEEWKFVVTNQQNEVLGTFSGTNTRNKQ